MKNGTVKISISFPPDVLERAKKKAKKEGFKNSFSAYIQKLAQTDIDASKAQQPLI